MKWVTIAVALVAIAPPTMYVHSQCFTDDDRFNIVLDTNLSGISDFGLDLFRELLPQDSQQNLFFSPYSIWSALSLAYFGAKGNTESQLQSALRVSNKIGTLRLWKALEITHQLRSLVSSSYTFNLANRIYVDNRLSFRECIANLLSNEVQHIDFSNKLDAIDTINQFVEDTTAGRIKDLVTPEAISSDTRMVLVNAVYFKGMWQNQFEPTKTQSKDFTTNQITRKVDMMQLSTTLKYGKYEELGSLLELPYVGNVVSMYLLLPSLVGDTAFYNVVHSLKGPALQKAMSNLQLKSVNLQLPKFTLETTLGDELSQALKNIGIVDLFDKNTGNLTTFVEGMNLSVDKSIHKAFVEVSEEGVEAAAATAFVINTRSGVRVNTISFHCNRPFIFFLYDNDTNNILFMGAYRTPKSESISIVY